MLNRWLRTASPALLIFPAFFVASDAWVSRGETDEAETPGAIDLTLPGYLGPATNEVLGPNGLAIEVGANVAVNDRTLCPNGRGLIQSETSIAVAGNVVVAAFNDSRGVCMPDQHAAVGWGFSFDNGDTWTDGGTLPMSRQMNNGDPWLGVSPDGSTFYLAGLYNGYQGFGFHRGTVTKTGIDWAFVRVVSFPPNATHDKEAIAVNPITGRIHLTYTRFGSPGGIFSSYSDDSGDTWSSQVPVQAGGGVQGSFPAIDGQGNLYVGLVSSGTVRVYRSADGGDSFQAVASFPYSALGVPFMDRSSDFPQLAVDTSGGPYDGFVYVVWHSGVGGWNRPMIAHSEDGGTTWTSPMPVNQDDVSAPHWWPSVSVDANGTVNVVYLDRRNNPGTGLTDLYLSQSTDGGYSFTDTQVTDVTSSWQGIRTDPGFTYAGDYLRGVTQGTSLYTVWPDPRNGDPDVYFSRIDTAALAARNNSR
jgi:hypothetical protein